MSEEAQPVPEGEPKEALEKAPRLFRNYISFIGAAIVVASFSSIVLLFLLEITGAANNPYLGIFTYLLFPAFLIFGLFIILIGMLRERRRRRNLSSAEIAAYPKLDLNYPRSSRK